ncbi:MAG: helix-turn-helix transcriptional regulator [Lachnospiraceae bacterium]|nr:helix-turn-helix transcriptional regulator [Lachnospiraceae bacterium]
MGRKRKDEPNSPVHDYTRLVTGKIIQCMEYYSITQKDLAEKCHISQSTLSKILKGDITLTLPHLLNIAKALDIDPGNLASFDEISFENETGSKGPVQKKTSSGSKGLIRDPDSHHFKGILGNYFFYCKPTISSEQNLFLKGKFRLEKAKAPENYCKAILELNTGKVDDLNKPIQKVYTGSMVISELMYSCTAIMCSEKYADFCCLNFTHSFLHDQKLLCRLAACLTTSAGISTSRRPVMLKCILSREPLDEEDLKKLEGQLNMNSALIRVSKDDFEKYIIPAFDSPEELEHLKESAVKETMYTWAEDTLRGSGGKYPYTGKAAVINLLRRYSTSEPYIKVSAKGDEFLFSYIEEKKRKKFQKSSRYDKS